jgi:uncharacterized membrane protein YidH (DUF202 family)
MSIFKTVLWYFHAAPLKNTGSLARDLLASERTFLAWTRTGLGFIALGVALEKVEVLAAIAPALLQTQDSRTTVAAGILVGSGTLCIGHGTQRYFSTLKQLQEGFFKPNVPGITMAAGASIAIAMAGAFIVLEKEGKKHRLKGIDEAP